jgi:phosphatidylserine/phosphatidylglycerophosphate/cardiolipin synthase-like enzyme
MKYSRIIAISAACVFLLAAVTCIFQLNRKLPEGLDYASREFALKDSEIRFLYDLSYENPAGETIRDQIIFDVIFSLIDDAKAYILIDMFLFNPYTFAQDSSYRPLTDELSARLIAKKQSIPDIKIDFITDPINTAYGGSASEELKRLSEAGVNVIVTDLEKLRDSNILYIPWWRILFQWFGNSTEGGWLPHPFSASTDDVTLRTYLTLLNFKANHRKVVVADSPEGMVSIVTSANAHTASSAHSNVALKISGAFWQAVYASENAVAELSGHALQKPSAEKENRSSIRTNEQPITARLLTERKIKESLLDLLRESREGDAITIAQFYLSDRIIIRDIHRAAQRGARIRLILDPNKDAFGYKKPGIPNRPVAHELHEKSDGRFRIRWYDTSGEQFHTKLALFDRVDKPSVLILGSANFTRRNLENYNLEMDVAVSAPADSELVRTVKTYLDTIWYNTENHYTVSYAVYADSNPFKSILYRLQETTGACSF